MVQEEDSGPEWKSSTNIMPSPLDFHLNEADPLAEVN